MWCFVLVCVAPGGTISPPRPHYGILGVLENAVVPLSLPLINAVLCISQYKCWMMLKTDDEIGL